MPATGPITGPAVFVTRSDRDLEIASSTIRVRTATIASDVGATSPPAHALERRQHQKGALASTRYAKPTPAGRIVGALVRERSTSHVWVPSRAIARPRNVP